MASYLITNFSPIIILLFTKGGQVLVLKTRLLPLLLLDLLFSYFNYISYYTFYKVYYYT
jgi:hypothetical protein